MRVFRPLGGAVELQKPVEAKRELHNLVTFLHRIGAAGSEPDEHTERIFGFLGDILGIYVSKRFTSCTVWWHALQIDISDRARARSGCKPPVLDTDRVRDLQSL